MRVPGGVHTFDDRPLPHVAGRVAFQDMDQQGRQLPEPSAAQMTMAVGPSDLPVWNQTLYFTYPTAELESDGIDCHCSHSS